MMDLFREWDEDGDGERATPNPTPTPSPSPSPSPNPNPNPNQALLGGANLTNGRRLVVHLFSEIDEAQVD